MTERESARDIIVRQAVESLAPDRSLDRLTSAAQFLLGAGAAIGGALTGYGALGSDQVKDHPVSSLIALAAFALTAALAAWSLVGRPSDLNLENEDELLGFLNEEVRTRGWRVKFAGVAFAVALVAAGVTGLLPESKDEPEATLSVTRGAADGHDVLTISGDAGRPGEGATLDVSAETATGRTLATGHFAPARSGDLKFDLTAVVPARAGVIHVEAHLTRDDKRRRLVSYDLRP
jgi:hypothetical protein